MALIELRLGNSGVLEYDRVAVAIQHFKNFERFALSINPTGYYIADSGGKDSGVIKALVHMSGCKYSVHHNHTGLDDPETVYFVRREKARLEAMGIDYTIEMPEMSFWALMRKNGCPPTRIRRYCCQVLKEGGGQGYLNVTGVRKAESVNRSTRTLAETIAKKRKDSIFLNNDNDETRREFEQCILKDKVVLNPIIDWSDDDVWEFTRKYNIPYNPLYDHGYSRVGCIGCPMSTNMFNEWESHPKHKAELLRTLQRLIDKRTAKGQMTPFKSAEEYYLWWCQKIKVKRLDDPQLSLDLDVYIENEQD